VARHQRPRSAQGSGPSGFISDDFMSMTDHFTPAGGHVTASADHFTFHYRSFHLL
jgi:hypothetical protein